MSTRHIGIEIENESLSINQYQVIESLKGSRWELDPHEGSLRGGGLGWEVKTASRDGLPLEEAIYSLRELYPILTSGSGTWRAAVHVHVDTRDLNPLQTALALAFGYVVDKSIFDMTSPERVESNFCVPLSHKFSDVAAAIREIAAVGRGSRYGKYSSINANSLTQFGTLEFRHMRTPETRETVESVTECLGKIESFARAAHAVVNSAGWCDIRSRVELLPAFFNLINARYLWEKTGLRVDPGAVVDMAGALGADEPFDAMRYPLPALARAAGKQAPRRADPEEQRRRESELMTALEQVNRAIRPSQARFRISEDDGTALGTAPPEEWEAANSLRTYSMFDVTSIGGDE